VEIVGGVMMEALAKLVAHVAGLFRRSWPEIDMQRPVEPIRAAAAVGMLAIAFPLCVVAVGAMRLTSVLLHDQLLMFLVLLLGPLLVFAAALAVVAAAGGLAVALAVATDTPGASTLAWGFVVLGTFEAVTYAQAGWRLLAAFAAVATVIEMILLLSLPRSVSRTP
jgi:hypothetical protein